MSSRLKPKLKIFEIAYKRYHRELSDWSVDYLRAKDQQNALRIFTNRHRIKIHRSPHTQDLYWWDGEWYMSLRYIRETDQQPRPCQHCRGTGIVVTNTKR